METLNYAPADGNKHSKALARLAFLTFLYPIVVVSALYGEWVIAWSSLGHAPRPSADDPKLIAGSSWMHPFTGLILVGILPAAFASGVLWLCILMISRKRKAPIIAPLTASIVIWIALIGLVIADPAQVLNWWFD